MLARFTSRYAIWIVLVWLVGAAAANVMVPLLGNTAATVALMRAFAATGRVVTTAGIVFGISMFALAGSSVLSIAQIGTTIGVGILLDTLVVRSFVLPPLIALLGRWFGWPTWKATRPTRVNAPVRDQSAWRATTLR